LKPPIPASQPQGRTILAQPQTQRYISSIHVKYSDDVLWIHAILGCFDNLREVLKAPSKEGHACGLLLQWKFWLWFLSVSNPEIVFLFLPSLDTLVGLIFSPQSQRESLCLTEQSGGVEMCQKVQDWKSLEAIVP